MFVRPDDIDLWFPQEVIHIKEPGGVAFVCHARFGNPGALGHVAQKGILWCGKLLVHAFRLQPRREVLRAVLSPAQLDELVEACASVAHHGPVPITRHDPPLTARIDTAGKAETSTIVSSTHVVHGEFPLILSWAAERPFSFEVRQTPRDEVVAEGDLSPGTRVKVVRKGTYAPPGKDLKIVELAEDGIYRVRSWADRNPVLGPALEFWLLIGKEYRRSATSSSGKRKPSRPFKKQSTPSRR